MKVIWVLLCSAVFVIAKSRDPNIYRTAFINYLKRNGMTEQMIQNYVRNWFHQTEHGHNRNTDARQDFWTKGEGHKFLDGLRKEYKRNENTKNNPNFHPIISVRMGSDDNDFNNLKEDFNGFSSNDNVPSTKRNNENHKTASWTNANECIPSATHVKGKQKCKDQLIFNENFDSIRKNIWNIDQKIAGAPDYEFVVYVDRPETREIIHDATINIKPVLVEDMFGPEIFNEGIDFGENCTEKTNPQDCKMKPDAGFMVPPIASAQLNTKNKFSFRFGKVEIRAKLPDGDWIYPILHLNPMRELYGKFYESGQIRIAFTEGNAPNNKNLKGGIILGDNDRARNYGMRNVTNTNRWSDTFHKYQLKWTPESISLSVDGTQYGIIEPPVGGFVSLTNELQIPNSEDWGKGTPLAPFDKEMYLQVGVGVGGFSFQDRNDGTKPWKNRERLQVKKFYQAKEKWLPSWKDERSSLNIDYIKIWAL